MDPRPDYRCIQRDGARYYGQHMMVSAYGCNDKLLDIPSMQAFLKTLADEIGMVRFGEAQVYRFGEGIEIGLSGFQLIETSQVSFHSNDGARDLYLDVFSCKEFSGDLVTQIVREWLQPVAIRPQTFMRD